MLPPRAQQQQQLLLSLGSHVVGICCLLVLDAAEAALYIIILACGVLVFFTYVVFGFVVSAIMAVDDPLAWFFLAIFFGAF